MSFLNEEVAYNLEGSQQQQVNNGFKHQHDLNQSMPSPPVSLVEQQNMFQQTMLIANNYQQQTNRIQLQPSNIYQNTDIINSLLTTNNNSNDSMMTATPSATVAPVTTSHHHSNGGNQGNVPTYPLQMQDQSATNSYMFDRENENLNGSTIIDQSPSQPSLCSDIDIKQYEGMSKEELIARLVVLEKEKQQQGISDKSQPQVMPSQGVSQQLMLEEEEEDTSAQSTPVTNEVIRTCLWINCGQNFDTLQKLISHINDTHVGSGKATYKCEWENCPRSDNPFTKRHKMYNHLRTHTGERPFVCTKPGCDKKFSRPDSLTTHIKTHSKVKPFVCRFKNCKKAYYHARSLKKHEKMHENGTLPPRPPKNQFIHQTQQPMTTPITPAPPPLNQQQQQQQQNSMSMPPVHQPMTQVPLNQNSMAQVSHNQTQPLGQNAAPPLNMPPQVPLTQTPTMNQNSMNQVSSVNQAPMNLNMNQPPSQIPSPINQTSLNQISSPIHPSSLSQMSSPINQTPMMSSSSSSLHQMQPSDPQQMGLLSTPSQPSNPPPSYENAVNAYNTSMAFYPSTTNFDSSMQCLQEDNTLIMNSMDLQNYLNSNTISNHPL